MEDYLQEVERASDHGGGGMEFRVWPNATSRTLVKDNSGTEQSRMMFAVLHRPRLAQELLRAGI